MNAEKCVACGTIIPEGRQVCPRCQRPPLGVQPHWLLLHTRMEALVSAIGRYLAYVDETRNIKPHADYYEAIAGWALELRTLAQLTHTYMVRPL